MSRHGTRNPFPVDYERRSRAQKAKRAKINPADLHLLLMEDWDWIDP